MIASVGCIAARHTPNLSIKKNVVQNDVPCLVHGAIAYAPYIRQFINQTYTAYEL